MTWFQAKHIYTSREKGCFMKGMTTGVMLIALMMLLIYTPRGLAKIYYYAKNFKDTKVTESKSAVNMKVLYCTLKYVVPQPQCQKKKDVQPFFKKEDINSTKVICLEVEAGKDNMPSLDLLFPPSKGGGDSTDPPSAPKFPRAEPRLLINHL